MYVKNHTLLNIFPEAISLFEYLHKAVNDIKIYFKDDDDQKYKTFLEETMIVPHPTDCNFDQFRKDINSDNVPIREVINRIVIKLVRSGGNTSSNLLCLGYRMMSFGASTSMRDCMDIENHYVNTIQIKLMTPQWQILSNRLGEKVFRYLLERPIFIRFKNGCFIQISGTPAADLAKAFENQKNKSSNHKKSLTPVIGPSTPILRLKMLYNHQPTFGIGLTPYHPFLKCSPEDLAKELFSEVECKALSYDQVGSIMVPLLMKLKDNYDRLDKVGAMKKYCLKAYKDDKENQERIERNKEDLTSIQQNQNDNIKSKKRTRRGTRAGKLVKKRKTQSNIISSNKSNDHLSSSDPIDSTKQNNILASSNNSSIIHQPFLYNTIGDHLVDKLFASIGKDISSSLEGFKTQEDTQNSFQSNQSSSILELISSNIPSFLSKSQKAKIRRKFRKLILSKKKVSTVTSSSNNVVDMLVENLPRTESIQQGNEPGLFYHLSRRYPSLPQESEPPKYKTKALNESLEIWESSIPREQVSEYIKCICRHVFTVTDFFGSNHNLNAFLSQIHIYLLLGRAETINLSNILYKQHLSEFPWIKSIQTILQQQYNEPHCSRKKRKFSTSQIDEEIQLVVCQFFYWIFNSFINNLIANHFYVTEIEGKDKDLFYFQKKTWFKIVQNNLKTFGEHFFPVDLNENTFEIKTPLERTSSVSTVSSTSNIAANSFSRTSTMGSIQLSNQSSLHQPPNLASVSSLIVPNKISDSKQVEYPNQSLSTSSSHPVKCRSITSAFKPHQQNNLPSNNLNKGILFNEILRSSTEATIYNPSEWSKVVEQSRDSLSMKRSISVPAQVTFSSELNNSTSAFARSTSINSAPNLAMTIAEKNPSMNQYQPNNTTLPLPFTGIKRKLNIKFQSFLKRIPVVRFVPKKMTIRPITNLRTKTSTGASNSTVNYQYNNISFNTAAQQTNNIQNKHPAKASHPFLPSVSSTSNSLYTNVFNEVLTNSSLYNCLNVLTHIYEQYPQLVGFGVFSNDDVYAKLHKFKETIRSSAIYSDLAQKSLSFDPEEPPFYVATLDLEKCYDHIDPSRLYDIMHRILEGDSRLTTGISASSSSPAISGVLKDVEPIVHRYNLTHYMHSLDKPMTKYIRYVSLTGELLTLDEASQEISSNYRNSLIQDMVVHTKYPSSEILKLLKIHLFQHLVRLPSSHLTSSPVQSPTSQTSFHTQIKGIPQGSVLSSLLCNFYYGDLERQLLDHFIPLVSDSSNIEIIPLSPKLLILRITDDYLLISTEKHLLNNILSTMFQQYPLYQSYFNISKIKTNYTVDDPNINYLGKPVKLHPFPRSSNGDYLIPWCGLLLNCRTLEVFPNYSKLLHEPLSWKKTIIWNISNIGIQLPKSIKRLLRTKIHALFLDNRNVNVFSSYLHTQSSSLDSNNTILPSKANSGRNGATHVETFMLLYCNLYSMYLLGFIRFICQMKKLKKFYRIHFHNISYLSKCFADSIIFLAKLIHIRSGGNKISKKLHFEDETMQNDEPSLTKKISHFGCCPISSIEAQWLGWKALREVLERRKLTFDGLEGLGPLAKREELRCVEEVRNGLKETLLASSMFISTQETILSHPIDWR